MLGSRSVGFWGRRVMGFWVLRLSGLCFFDFGFRCMYVLVLCNERREGSMSRRRSKGGFREP